MALFRFRGGPPVGEYVAPAAPRPGRESRSLMPSLPIVDLSNPVGNTQPGPGAEPGMAKGTYAFVTA